jgi:hypothetical protein
MPDLPASPSARARPVDPRTLALVGGAPANLRELGLSPVAKLQRADYHRVIHAGLSRAALSGARVARAQDTTVESDDPIALAMPTTRFGVGT